MKTNNKLSAYSTKEINTKRWLFELFTLSLLIVAGCKTQSPSKAFLSVWPEEANPQALGEKVIADILPRLKLRARRVHYCEDSSLGITLDDRFTLFDLDG